MRSAKESREHAEAMREYAANHAASREWWRARVVELGRQGHPIWVIQERTGHHFETSHVRNLLHAAGVRIAGADE